MTDLTRVRMPGDSLRVRDTSELLNVETPCFVTVLLHDRAYGGPEEGGWWFDYETPVETHLCVNDLTLSLVANRVFYVYSNEGRYPVSSVLSDGEYVVRVGDAPDTGYPDERPRYC